MELWMLILCVIPTIVTTITISPNGNSPETKMIGGMIGDGLKINTEKDVKSVTDKSKYTAYVKAESPKLAINERYRRLIPYMTFYYANDLVPPPPKPNIHNVEVEKAEIVESETVKPNEREPKVIYTTQRHKNIPRYHGNRLTQFNIASSNPTKIFYKELPILRQNTLKPSVNYNPTIVEHSTLDNRDLLYHRFVPQQIKAPSAPFSAPTKKTFLNSHQNDAYSPNIQYYTSDQEIPKYRLIPYEQTPPVKVINTNTGSINQYSYNTITSPEPVYTKVRPTFRPQPFSEGQKIQAVSQRKPETISEVYYEKSPTPALVEPVIENGFKPIMREPVEPIETSVTREEVPYNDYKKEKQQGFSVIKSVSVSSDDATYQPQYVIERPVHKATSNSVTLAELLNSLQINKSIPKPITRENVGDSIRTLLQVLNTLKAAPLQNDVEIAVVSTPKPFEPSEISVATPVPYVSSTTPKSQESDLHEEPYLAPVQTPSQYLDDYPTGGGNTQRFPLPVTSDEEGGTPGRPGIDYPILSVIPPTKFDCKTQRYKGFFADTDTKCQVWHYCDLNGGQASFLCPNGTIFSQAGLTCDWWFNVRCASTAQLYVLNESLYKYILPHSPKFPEDYSGPLVDKYLSLKFKEMEEQFKKNKNKKVASEKMDTEDSSSSEASDKESSTEESADSDKISESSVNQADVIIETSGNSGNVQRLQDE